MIKIFYKNKINNGYAVLELLFYIVFFTILSLVVINAMVVMARSFKETSIQSELIQSGTIMEKISRELKQANNFSFTASPGILVVDTKDENGVPKTVTFTLADTNLQVTDSLLGNLGNLNVPNIAVTNFNVVSTITVESKAAQIFLTIKSNNDASGRTIDFQDTVVLRGSYQ